MLKQAGKATGGEQIVELNQALGYELMNPVAESARISGFQFTCFRGPDGVMIELHQREGPRVRVNGFDYLRTECNTDIGRGPWVYGAPSNVRANGGWARIVDDASVDFMAFRCRDSSASPALMALRQWQNLATGGSLSLYIMGRLDNHRDVSALAPMVGLVVRNQRQAARSWHPPEGVALRMLSVLSRDGAAVECFVLEPETDEFLPGMLFCHGGGFFLPVQTTALELAAVYAQKLRMRVFVPEYRILPEHPNPYPFQDCRAVWTQMLEQAEAYRLDGRILLYGESAGGALASINNRGPFGVCGASGVGIQHVAAVLHEAGTGVSQTIGTSGNGLKNEVAASCGAADLRRAL